MLEDTRKRGATILVYLVFGLLIVVFAISFGPQSIGGGQGCQNAGASTIVTLDGQEYGMNTWRWAMNTRSPGPYPARAQAALDRLVRRELLAQEAESRGMKISDDIVDEKLKAGDLWILGEYVDGKQLYFEDGEFFNYDALLNGVVRRFGLTIGPFKDEMRRELLALAMEQILGAGARVARDEVFSEWLHSERTVTFQAVVFDAARYRKAMTISDADADRYLAAHTAEVQAKYDADKAAKYTATVPQVKVRRVFVGKEDQAKLEAARAEIVAEKKTVADVAAALDRDPGVRARRGELGWKIADAPDLGDPALTEALKALTPGGEPSPVIETATGAWLLAVEDKREGDLTFDQVKREIAADLAADAWAKEAARRAAEAALAEAKAGKKLQDMFEADVGVPSNEEFERLIEQQLQNPNLTPEERQNFEQLLQRARSGELGMGPWESEDYPAEWQPAAEGDAPAGGGAPAAPPAPDHSKDVLPKLGDVEKPKLQVIGPMPRDKEQVGGVGRSAELVKALFEDLEPGAVAPRLFEVETTAAAGVGGRSVQVNEGAAYVIVQVNERVEPNVADFEKEAERLIAGEERARAAEIVRGWLVARCRDVVEAGDLSIGNDVLAYQDEQGKPLKFDYVACSNL